MTIPMKIEQLSFSYGEFKAVDGVSLELEANTIHSVIGPNGAGKTSFFNLLTGRLTPSSGRVLLNGSDITYVPEHKRPLKGLGRSFQITSLFPELTTLDNLVIAAQGPTGWKTLAPWWGRGAFPECEATARTLLAELGIEHLADTRAVDLSHGEQRVLEVGMGLAVKPQVLLLDEPTSGMGIDDVRQMATFIAGLRSKCAILLIEHNMDIVMGISDMVTVMAGGKVIAQGSGDSIKKDPVVKSVYLGEA